MAQAGRLLLHTMLPLRLSRHFIRINTGPGAGISSQHLPAFQADLELCSAPCEAHPTTCCPTCGCLSLHTSCLAAAQHVSRHQVQSAVTEVAHMPLPASATWKATASQATSQWSGAP